MAESNLTPFEKVICAWILKLPGTWTRLDWDQLTQTEDAALDRLVKGGFVQARLSVVLHVKGEAEPISTMWTVSGDYGRVLSSSVMQYLAAHGHEGKGTGIVIGHYEAVRLTKDGELAKQDFKGTAVASTSFHSDGTISEEKRPGVDYDAFGMVTGGPDGQGGVKPPGTVYLEPVRLAAEHRQAQPQGHDPSPSQVSECPPKSETRQGGAQGQAGEAPPIPLAEPQHVESASPAAPAGATAPRAGKSAATARMDEDNKDEVLELSRDEFIKLVCRADHSKLRKSEFAKLAAWETANRDKPFPELNHEIIAILELMGLRPRDWACRKARRQDEPAGPVPKADMSASKTAVAQPAQQANAGQSPSAGELVGTTPPADTKEQPSGGGRKHNLPKGQVTAEAKRKLKDELEKLHQAARDHAYSLQKSGKDPELLPQPSQKDLAKQLNISAPTLSRCLNEDSYLKRRYDDLLNLDVVMGRATGTSTTNYTTCPECKDRHAYRCQDDDCPDRHDNRCEACHREKVHGEIRPPT